MSFVERYRNATVGISARTRIEDMMQKSLREARSNKSKMKLLSTGSSKWG